VHSHWALIAKQKSNVLAIVEPDLDSRTLTCCVWPLHIHRQIIVSHDLVPEIETTMTGSKIGTQMAFREDMTLKIPICSSISTMTWGPSPGLCPNTIPESWVAGGAISRGKSLSVQRPSISKWVRNQAPQRKHNRIYSSSTAAFQNLAEYDYLLVKKSLAALVILQGQCQDTP